MSIPTRPLGNTGANVSILALGGWHIGDVADKAEAIRIMHAALDAGMNFFDNCWDYHWGGSEEIMGQALAADGGKWRKKCFLMSKVCARDAKNVRSQIEAAWMKAAEAALTNNVSTLTLLPVREMFNPDGYLAKLKAKGYVVVEPDAD